MKCCVADMNETQMANHLVKWWKTKFLNGYKQFTAVLPTDCSDGRPSDTEELLRPHSDELPSMTSPAAPPPLSKSPQSHLNFEGFECDVSVEGGGEGGGKDRQEFSFTLYDFDGHGKITKDDIASLVTTIYETLGSSIRVPHYGSKTIKVKLTVSPDQKTHSIPAPTPTTQNNNRNAPSSPQQPGRYKRDLNVTIRERRPRRHHHRRRHSVSSSAPSEDREADISEDDEEQPHTRLHCSNSRLGHTGSTPVNTNTCCGRNKKRSSSLQRQELLQIIQANMEKNNLCFQTSRKHNNVDTERQKSNNETSPLTNHNVWRGVHNTPRKRGPEVSQDLPRASTSPHHILKHRHREEEQARAMAQVVRWLEQEFSPPRQRTHQQSHSSPPPPQSQPNVQSTHHMQHHTKTRHEHHHIHEYIHHHYHHYQDTSVVV